MRQPFLLTALALLNQRAFADCNESIRRLEAFIHALPTECNQTAECGVYYYRGNSCHPPIILAKKHLSDKALMSKILNLQSAARNDCAPMLAKSPPCSPIPATPTCEKKKCVNGLANQNAAETPAASSTGGTRRRELAPTLLFTTKSLYGVLQNTCAPWDGPALNLTLTPEKPGRSELLFPTITITFWRAVPARTGSYTIDADQKTGNISVCLKFNGCAPATSGKVIFSKFEAGKGAEGTFEFITGDGQKRTGSFLATWNSTTALCG